MFVRDYFLIILIIANLPIGLFRPYYGMLVYTWISFMYPHLFTWSFGRTFPVAKVAAFSAATGTLLGRVKDTAVLRLRENVLMIFLWCLFTVSTIFAINPSDAWLIWQDVSKLVVMALITSMLLTDHRKVRYFLLVVAFSLGFHAVKGGQFAIRSGGQGTVYGPEPSIIAGNNNIGLAINMCLPILWYLAYEERGYLKMILYSMFFLSIPGVMFTYSRASALTLPLVLIAIVIKGRNRSLMIGSMLVGTILLLPFIPQRFWDRQNSILTYDQDRSAMSRLDNWKFCWDLAVDRPLTGGGFGYNTRDTFQKYAPEFLYTYGGRTWDTHSIYLAMLATHGFPGLLVFLAMITSCFFSCAQMRLAVRHRADLGWVTSYCHLLDVSLLALLINGAFVNMEYFDLGWDLVAVVASMRLICRRELSKTGSEEASHANGMVPVAV
jgi:putative inorganic carbon (HCO3(-)) transporter